MPPHLPGQDREREEDRQRTLGALRARLHDDAQALRTPDDWGACLGLATRLPGEDFANILLIHAQRPGATLVRDYQQWTAAGRQVRKGEHGIAIFAIPPRPRAQRQDRGPGRAWTGLARGRPGYLRLGPVPDHRAARQRRRRPPVARSARRRVGRLVLAGPPPGIRGRAGARAAPRRHRVLGRPPYPHPAGAQRRAGRVGTGAPARPRAAAPRPRLPGRDHHLRLRRRAQGRSRLGRLDHLRPPRHHPRRRPALPGQLGRHRPARPARRRHPGRRAPHHHSSHPHHPPHQPHPARRRPRPQSSPPAPAPPRRPPAPAQASSDAATPQAGTTVTQPAASHAPEPDGTIRRILADAHAFYTGQLAGSWAPGYLHARGITAAAIQDWHIGYAPAGWTALTSHLRRLGHHDDAIQAAGLATRSSRGTLIDRFRDRIMLPVHDAAGMLAGFTGRARPGAGPDTPKYLNSPETATYKKSHLLFGLYQARPDLARGAIPVIVEGAFDAIAVSIADPGRHAGLAPCGTALTSQQAAQLSQAADLPRTGILVAFDSDTAGRKAAIRAHGILRPLTGKLQSAALDGKDPAEILQRDGPAALRVILREHRQPLSALLIDASIEQWGRRLDDIDGPLLAMRSTASLIASLLPDDTASQIRDITAGRELQTTDDLLRPVDNPEIPQIARILPADTSYQIVRAAGKLGFDCTDVLAEVANATTRNTRSAGHQPCAPHNDQGRSPAAPQPSAARLASTSFPRPPLTPQASPGLPRRPAAPASRQRPARLAR